MTSKISDQDVLNLLSSLKNAESNYPSDMIQSRRETYMKQAAVMAVLAGSGGNGSTKLGSNQTTISSTATSTANGGLSMGTLLETALVVSLVVEAGVAAYIYRDKIADFINSTLSPKVETVASPPSGSSPDIVASEETSSETPEGTVTVIATETPVPVTLLPAAGDNGTNNNNGDTGGGSQVMSTPNPNEDPGLHLGQTKQPTTDPNVDQNNNNDKNKNVDNNKGKND